MHPRLLQAASVASKPGRQSNLSLSTVAFARKTVRPRAMARWKNFIACKARRPAFVSHNCTRPVFAERNVETTRMSVDTLDEDPLTLNSASRMDFLLSFQINETSVSVASDGGLNMRVEVLQKRSWYKEYTPAPSKKIPA